MIDKCFTKPGTHDPRQFTNISVSYISNSLHNFLLIKSKSKFARLTSELRGITYIVTGLSINSLGTIIGSADSADNCGHVGSVENTQN